MSSGQAEPAFVAAVEATGDETGGGSSSETTAPSGTGQPPPDKLEPLPEAIKPDKPSSEFAEDALAGLDWKLEHTEHLLYSHRPIKLPGRSRVTTWVRAPQKLQNQQFTSCLVDRLPHRDGLENPPQVIPRCGTIVDGHIAIEIINSRRSAYTIATHLPLAKLDTEYSRSTRGTRIPREVAWVSTRPINVGATSRPRTSLRRDGARIRGLGGVA